MKYLKGLKDTGLLKHCAWDPILSLLHAKQPGAIFLSTESVCACPWVCTHEEAAGWPGAGIVLLLPHSLRQGLSNSSAGWQVSSETCCCPCPCTRVTATCNNKCFPLEPSPLAPQPRGSSDRSAYLVVICRLLINRLSYHHGRTRYGPWLWEETKFTLGRTL